MISTTYLYTYQNREIKPYPLSLFDKAIFNCGLNKKVGKIALGTMAVGLFCLSLKNRSFSLGAASLISVGLFFKAHSLPNFSKPKMIKSVEELENCDPSEVEEIQLANLPITSLPSGFNPPKLRVLNLNGTQIAYLPKEFNPPNLEKLYLCDTLIRSLPDDFNPPKLTELYISSSPFAYFPEGIELPNLKVLYLCRTHIQRLPDSLRFDKLEQLLLCHCHLERLPDNFNPPQLTYFNAALSSLRYFPSGFNPPRLTLLYLHFSHISSLPANFNPPNLNSLMLDGCSSFTRLPESILNLSSDCTVSLTLSNFPLAVQRRLTHVTSQEHYIGPRFEFDMSTAHSNEGSASPSVAIQNLLDQASDSSNGDILLDALLQNANDSSTTSENIHIWLDRIFWSASANTQNKEAFFKSIAENLKIVSQDDELRSFFQDLVGGTTPTCGDGITLSTLHLANQVKAKTIALEDIKSVYDFLIDTVYKMDVLHKTADNIIPTLRTTDPIEVYLGLPLQLKEEFNIGININEMLFLNFSGLEDEHLTQAKENLREALSDKDKVMSFLIEQPKWLELIEHHFKDQYRDLIEKRNANTASAELSVQAEREYKDALRSISRGIIDSIST